MDIHSQLTTAYNKVEKRRELIIVNDGMGCSSRLHPCKKVISEDARCLTLSYNVWEFDCV